jgi:predicted NAD-dependent protein-ADP-ribosyltransferase YbiA (DUF1768 family)
MIEKDGLKNYLQSLKSSEDNYKALERSKDVQDFIQQTDEATLETLGMPVKTGDMSKRYAKYSNIISPFIPQSEMEKQADILQGTGESWRNAVIGFGANTAAGFLDALGATVSPDKISNMFLGNTEKDFTNSLSRTANSIREWSNENIPIYNGNESMWTSAYWANQFSQLGTTAGIIGEGFVEQGVLALTTGGFGNVVGAGATATKVAKLLNRVKALNTANKVNRAGNYTFGMYQGVKEAYINGLENLNNVYQNYLQKGYSDEEARRVASEAASRSFKYEIGPVMFLNALQWGSIGSRYNPYSRKAVGGGISGFTESVFTKLAPKTTSKGVKKATDWAGNILSEGVEEGFQTAVQGISQYQADKERNLTKGTPLSDYIFTKELRDSVIGGMIGGGMFKALGSVRRGIIDGKDRKADERFIETFIDTTAERTKENLKKLDAAVKSGDTKAAEAIKKQMGFDNIEAALLFDYMKNDEKMTAYNAQVDQLKEISRIIKEGDIRGLELLELRNEKDENGENTFAYLRDNIDRMISDAELQKENHIKNLQLQMDLTGVENYDLAERTTRLQMMQNENNRTLEKRKESLDSLFNIERNATNNEDILEYKKLQSLVTAYNSTTTKFSNPEIQKEVTEAKERIETLERDNPSFMFDEKEYENKQLIDVQSDILKIREANFEINKDIKQLTTNQGINEYRRDQIRQSILDYDQINSTTKLNSIKETLQKDEEINKYFSKKEIEKISKGIDNRISKLQSIEKAQAAEKLRKNNEVIKTKTKPIITPEGKLNTEVVTDDKIQKEVQINIDKIDKIRNNTSVGIVEDARSLIENSKDIPEDSFVLFQEQEENIFFEAPREFNDRNSIVRGNMKKGATNFLKRNKDATLKDYITAFINTPGVEVGDVEALYYYIADGYYEAKDQRYSDNREEVEEVYRDIFEPFNALQLIQDNINLVPETKPTPSEQVEIEKKIDTTIVEKQIEKAQPVKVDKNGRNIYYIGPKIAVPAIKVPFPGNPYNVVYNKTKSGSTEVLFIRDKEAETKEVLSGAAGLEATKRAFMMNPFLAKAGVPIQVYIPPLQELLDDSKGFIVSTWTRKGKDGPLEKGTESFSIWYNREKEKFEKENPGKEFIGSDKFLEKVPIFSYVEINGERVQIGSAIHETAWWNELNVADFRNSEDLKAALNSPNEEEREIANLTAKSRQQAVINEGREQTLEVRRIIWNNTNKEDWNDGIGTLVKMKIKEVTDGFSLKIDPKEPKRKIREANNDLRLGIILVDSNKSISVAYDSKNGKERYIPQKYIYNPSVLSGDYVGYAVSLIPYAIHEDGKPMYLVQLVDTGYTNAQETLKYLYDTRGKIRQLNQDYQTARARNNIPAMQKLEKQLKDIMTVAGFSEEKINTYFKLEDKDARYKILRDNLLRFYPKETEQGNLKTSFEKDNISGDIANIVVFDEQGNPKVYKPNPESQESSYVQMLKETIYTQNDYIEIRDLRKEDPNATIKIANAQPRVHLVFDEEVTTEKLEFKRKELEQRQQEEAEEKKEENLVATSEEIIQDSPKFELTPERKYTIVNHLFNKILQSFKEDKTSRKNIAIETRRAIETHLSDLKETNPDLYNGILENKGEILGLGEYRDKSLTVREALLNHFNMETLEEMDDVDLDTESVLEKDHSKIAQEYDVKTSLSSKIKRVFSGIPVNDKNRRGEYIEGITEYMELDDVFSALQDLLSDVPNDFTVLKERVRERIKLNPEEFEFLSYIQDILENIDPQLQHEVLFRLNQTKNRMYFIYSKENKGNYVLQVLDANSRHPFIFTKNTILEQFKNSDIVENLGNGEYSLNKERAQEFINIANLISKSGNIGYETIRNFFATVGIYVEESTLEAMDKNDPGAFRNIVKNLTEQLKKNVIALKDYTKPLNFDEKVENVVLRENNNYLNNFIGEIIKFTFNVDQSMYVGGKIINSFSQPNFFTEQLRKISSLKGSDLSQNNKHLINKLLNNGYTKNNLLVKLITQVDEEFEELLKESKEILEELSVGYTSLEVLKRKGFRSKDQQITELSPSDYDTALIGYFGNMDKKLSATEKGIPLRMSYMTSPTLSDSSQMFLMKTVVLDLNRSHFKISNSNIDSYNNTVAEILYEQLVLPELTRMIEVKGTERDTVENQLFYGVPALNSITTADGKNILYYIRENDFDTEEMLSKIKENFGEAINNIIRNVVKNEVEEKLKIDSDGNFSGNWVKNGFIYKEKDKVKVEVLDTKYLNSKNPDGTPLSKVETAAWEYAINYLVTQAQMQALFAGDPANYSKAKSSFFENKDVAVPKTENNTAEEKLKVYIGIAEETSINLSKRLKALISPGNRIAYSASKQYIQLMLQDSSSISDAYKEYLKVWYGNIPSNDMSMVDRAIELSEKKRDFEGKLNPTEVEKKEYLADLIELSDIKKDLSKKYPEVSGYLENIATDAQEYTTWKEHLEVAYNMGKISEEEYNNLNRKLTEQSKGNIEGNRLSSEEKFIFQPMKPLHSGMYFRGMNNGKTYQEFVYVKTSSFPLIPEMTKDLKIDNLRKNMERLEETKGLTVRAAYESGIKVGKTKTLANTNQLLDNDNVIISDSFSILDRENFSIQQEKPFKTDKHLANNERDEIGRGTQMEKILLSNGINKISRKIFPNIFGKELLSRLNITPENDKISGEDLYKIYTDLSITEQNLKKDFFLKSLDVNENDYQIGSVSSMEKLQAALNKRLTNRQDKEILELKYFVKDEEGNGKYYTKDEIEAFNLKPVSAEFTFPIWLSPNSRKFESVLNSMITNEFIKLKFPGNSSPVASAEGFVSVKTIEELSQEDVNGIVFTDSYNGKGLLPERVEYGIVKPAQVLVASKFRVKRKVNGEYIEEIIDFNTPEYINPETKRIDNSKLPPEVRQLFSFRIPSSAHQSGSLIEIVGFLPHHMGDLMIVPKEHTTKIGEDYDIDVRYSYSGNYVVNEDGSIRFLSEKDVPVYPKEELDRIYNEYRDYKVSLIEYIKKNRPNSPNKENEIRSEIATTQFLINILEAKGIDENSEEIEALNLELNTLIGSLNENKEEITPERRKEIQGEIKNLHDKFLEEKKYKIEEYLNARKFFGTKLASIENELINLYKSVYSSTDSEIQRLITTTINTDMAQETAKMIDTKIKSSQKKDNFTIYGYEHQKSTLRLGASGKLGIGVHSNWVVWNGLVQQSEKEIALIDDGELFSMRIGNFVSDGKLGNIYALRPNLENVSEDYKKRYESFKPRRISDINMENQNSATDNQKLQIMGRRNENKYTINVFALMNNLGFDKDIVVVNGEEREILIPSLFISQPIIRRYVELKEQYSSTFADFTRDIESVITEQLRVEFANNVEFPVDPLTKELIPFLDTETMSKVSKELTGQLLYDSLVTPYSQITQWAVYQKFVELQGHSNNVNKVIQLMNIDKGLGVSYFNIISKKNSLIDEMNSINLNISNVEFLFGETPPEPIYDNEESAEKIKELLTQNYIKIGKDENTGEIFLMKPNSPNSAKLLNSISIGYYLWGNIFPFENKYLKGQIDEIIGDRPEIESTMELRYNILSAMREYMYSSNMFNLYDGIADINQERRRLLMDEEGNESLASYLMRLKKLSTTDDTLKNLFNKHFFRNLEFSINKKEPSIIKYNVNSNNSFNKNLPHSELLLMSDSLIELPAYNGDENYTYEKLVKDLTKYAMLTNTENGAIGFRNYIPMAVFQKYNFDSQLHYLADLNTDSGKYFNMTYNGTLSTITSFLGNNVIIEDESGTYIEVPEKFLSSKEILEELIDNVNSSFGSEKKAVELDSKRGRVIINRPLSEVNKRRFIRQFYQHNPEQATKLSYKDLGINNRNLINSVSEFEYTFKEEIPNYVSIKGINGEVFLYELVETDINKSSKYRRINKLGGFGVNEYNTNSDVNISMFDSNNPKISELKPVGKKKGTIGRNAIFNLPTTPEAAITINEVMTIFENAELDINNKEVITLSGLLADIQKFIDPNTKVYKGQLESGSPGAYNSKTNTIILDTTQFSKDRRVNDLYRVFSEEVFHSITAREVDKYIVGNNTTLEVGIDSVEVKADYLTENTPAHITKLVRLYKTAAEALIKEESQEKNISWSQAYENIIKRYKENPTNTDAYRISNLHEFMAGIFTDDTFRSKMSKIQFKDTNTSILQQFADFVRRTLQFISERIEGNISEQTLSTVYDFISSIHNNVASSKVKTTKTFDEMRKTDNKAKALVSDLKKPLTSSLYSKLYKSDRIKSLSPTNIVSILNKNNREVIAPEGIITATIINSERHFGNPFTPNQSTKDKNPGMVKVKDTQEATEKYMNWVLNGGLPQFENRRQWMLEQFKSGNLKGKPILVNQGSEDISYNNAIDYFINEHQWKQTQKPVEKIQTQTKSNIKFEEGNILDLFKVETQNETINIYAGTNENAELSNFAIRPFTVNVETPSGEKQYTFQSVEQGFHFYKALVANNPQVAKQILATTNGGQLKRLTRSNLKMTPEQVKEWDDTSKSIMLNLMYESYAQNPKAASKLLATGNAKITHTQDNTRWKTDFPEVVMTVRDMLREEGFGNNNTTKFEEDQSTGYKQRTIKNASADATIAIAVDFNSAGEILTKNSVLNQGKVYMPIDGNRLEVTKERVDKIVNALNSIGKDEISLNIAGNGIYTMRDKYTQEQVDKFTYDLLKAIVESSDLKVKISSIRTGGQTGFDEAGAKAGIKLGIPVTVLAPKGWKFRDINGKDISNEKLFKERFNNENQNVKEQGNEIKSTEKNEDPNRNITGKSKFNFAPKEIKKEVLELFDSNPKLANQVYKKFLGIDHDFSMDSFMPKKHWKIGHIIDNPTEAANICDNTQIKVLNYILNKYGKPSERGTFYANPVTIWTKSPINDKQIFHHTVAVRLEDGVYLYDMPQSEFIEYISENVGRVIKEYSPRLIKYTPENLKKYYGTSEENLHKQDSVILTDDLKIIPIQVTPQQKQQAVQSYSEYVEQTGKRDIEGFRQFVDKTIQKNQIENKKDIGKENNYVSAPREINLDFSIFTELKDDIFSNCRN